MPVNQAIFDEILDNALLVFRYAANERAATFGRLKELERELIGRLNDEAIGKAQHRRVESFISEVESIIEFRYTQLQLDFQYAEFARIVAEDLHYGIGVALGTDALYLPSDSYFISLASEVMILGAPSADWWRGQSQALAFNFAREVRQGLANAETNQQIISRIVGKSGQPGIMETARRSAAALVQTSVQAVANDARRNTFQANSDVISGIQQVSTLDSHTSLICVSYSGAEWDLEYKPIGKNKKPYNGGCPRHFNCRSLEVPITKGERPKFTTRASDEGQIEADTTFNTFLKRKSKVYQDKMLGVGRAELWRAGKITLKDLVDGKGRPLTLGELQALIKSKRR